MNCARLRNMPTEDVLDGGEDASGVGAGIARSLVRQGRSIARLFEGADAYVARWMARADIGSLPRKVPARNLGRLSDRLSTMKDAYDSWQEGATKHQHQQKQQIRGRFREVANRLYASAAHGLPPFTKNFFLGAALFSSYDAVDENLTALTTSETQPDNEKVARGSAQPFIAVLAGAAAGASHGALTFLYQAIAERRSFRIPNVCARLNGTLALHSLSHGTLFGTFGLVKHRTLLATGTDHLRWDGVATVATAGAIAGMAQEAVAYYAVSMERRGIRRGCRAAMRLPPPGWRGVVDAAPGSAVGFLAFEYGRSVASELIGGDDDDDDSDIQPG